MKVQSSFAILALVGYGASHAADIDAGFTQQHPADNTHHEHEHDHRVHPITYPTSSDPVPVSTREHWMQRAVAALREITGSPCPFQAFGTAVVNHTASTPDGLGTLVCTGANNIARTGNPTLHGEIAGIDNCTVVLSKSPYNLSPAEIAAAWGDLTLYTTAEACPMCAAAIGWAGFREYVYATDSAGLTQMGWSQYSLTSAEVLWRGPAAGKVRIVGGILADVTDRLFKWQFMDGPCPGGCAREEKGERRCVLHDE